MQRANRERQKLRRDAKRCKAGAAEALAVAAPAMASAPPSALGFVSEAFADALADYVEANPDGLLKDKVCPLQA